MNPRTPSISARALLALLLVWAAVTVRAEISAAGFETANKLYYEGKFSEAAAAYESLTRSNEHAAALYFNLGNALFKSSQIGRAIAAYREAERITPRDPDVRANLQFARNQVQGPTSTPSRWQRWLGRLTLNEWTVLAAGAGWIWLLTLALVQWRPALRKPLRYPVAGLTLAAVGLGICLVLALREGRPGSTAIAITRDLVIRRGPLQESESAFTVHDGAELEVVDEKDQWLQISAGPRRIGWVLRDQVVLAPHGEANR